MSFVYFWFILIVYRKCWMLYLFKLAWNTQKITRTSTKARCFLILEMFLCLNAPPYCFFLYIFEVRMSNFYWANLRNIAKQNWHKFISKLWGSGVTPCKSFSILASFFMPRVGPKWNKYLYLCLANFENQI